MENWKSILLHCTYFIPRLKTVLFSCIETDFLIKNTVHLRRLSSRDAVSDCLRPCLHVSHDVDLVHESPANMNAAAERAEEEEEAAALLHLSPVTVMDSTEEYRLYDLVRD